MEVFGAIEGHERALNCFFVFYIDHFFTKQFSEVDGL